MSANIKEEEPPIYRGRPTLTRQVYQILKDHPKQWVSRDEIRALIEKDKEGVHGTYHISDILAHLERSGFAELGQFKKEKRSDISLNDEQRKMLLELIEILDKFQKQDLDILTQGRKYAQYFLSHPQDLSELMAKARQHSPNANQASTEQTAEKILYIISFHPEITSTQIQDELKKEGKYLGKGRIWRILRVLLNDYQITFSQKGRQRKFTIVS